MDLGDMQLRITEYVILRPLKLSDAQDSFDLVCKNRKNLKRWLPWVDFINSVTDEANFIKESIAARMKGEKYEMGIFTKLKSKDFDETANTNQWKLIGMCGFPEIKDKSGSLGYWLDADYRGKGIVTMACRCILSELPKLLNLNEVVIRVLPENTDSLNVAKKLGFEMTNQLKPSKLFGKDVLALEFKYRIGTKVLSDRK